MGSCTDAEMSMKTGFLAKVASFRDDGYATLLAFADDSLEPMNYVMLDLANEPDEQERKLGLHGVHIETGAPNVEGYDLVQDICETDAGIVVSLAADAAQKAGIGKDIEIGLEGKIIDGTPVSEAVRRFKDRLMTNDDPIRRRHGGLCDAHYRTFAPRMELDVWDGMRARSIRSQSDQGGVRGKNLL